MFDTIIRHAAVQVNHSYLSIDPHSEGARAALAGLTEDENPYLWPPGAHDEWAAGYQYVRDITDTTRGAQS